MDERRAERERKSTQRRGESEKQIFGNNRNRKEKDNFHTYFYNGRIS